MNDDSPVNSAVDAVRCLYLARIAEREGHYEAAGCWLKKANRWLKTFAPRQPPTRAAVNSQGRKPLDARWTNQNQLSPLSGLMIDHDSFPGVYTPGY